MTMKRTCGCLYNREHTCEDSLRKLSRFLRFEHRDGPRYVEAIRGAREMRERETAEQITAIGILTFASPPTKGHVWDEEAATGIPEGWITR